jgi:hypothetical protein
MRDKCLTRRILTSTALNITAVGIWALLLLEVFSSSKSSISDYGSALGLVVLFFLIPVVWVRNWVGRRRRPESPRGWERRYLQLSTAFLAATWVVSWIPIAFWIGIAGTIASQRWPINMREGPDTEFAKEGFRMHFGFSPAGVDDLYYQRGWEFGDGNTHRMRFHFEDPAVIGRIVRAAGLEPASGRDLTATWVVESDPPDWWSRDGVSKPLQIFRRHARPRLWVDVGTATAYYRSWP